MMISRYFSHCLVMACQCDEVQAPSQSLDVNKGKGKLAGLRVKLGGLLERGGQVGEAFESRGVDGVGAWRSAPGQTGVKYVGDIPKPISQSSRAIDVLPVREGFPSHFACFIRAYGRGTNSCTGQPMDDDAIASAEPFGRLACTKRTACSLPEEAGGPRPMNVSGGFPLWLSTFPAVPT
jgi:hypothetical protein